MLVQSIRHRNTCVPGEGFERAEHPFDVPVMPVPGSRFWPTLGHMDRKFWAFQGPFESFLYLDADTICTASLDPLIRRLAQQQKDFVLVQPWIDVQGWSSVIRDPTHIRATLACSPVGVSPSPRRTSRS